MAKIEFRDTTDEDGVVTTTLVLDKDAEALFERESVRQGVTVEALILRAISRRAIEMAEGKQTW